MFQIYKSFKESFKVTFKIFFANYFLRNVILICFNSVTKFQNFKPKMYSFHSLIFNNRSIRK